MKTKSFTLLFFLVLVGLALSACGEVSLTRSDPNVTGVQARATLEYIQAVQTSTAQAHKAEEWRATVQAGATQDAMQATYVSAQATQEAKHAAGVAAQTQQAWSATATSDSVKSTATAAATATAASWYGTATQAAWNRQATVEAASLMQMQTAQASQAELAQMAVERQRTINNIQAAAPWGILAIIVLLAAYLAWIWGKTEVLRRHVIPRDQRGDAPILILEDHGWRNVIDPDLFFGAVVSIGKSGKPEAPVLAVPELQAQLKARDQAVDMVNRGLPGLPQRSRSLPLPAGLPQNPAMPEIRVVDPGEIREWLADVLTDIHQQALEQGEVNDDRNE
jgi:hypothetical protein